MGGAPDHTSMVTCHAVVAPDADYVVQVLMWRMHLLADAIAIAIIRWRLEGRQAPRQKKLRTLLMLGRPHSSSVCTGTAARRRVIAVSGGCNHLAFESYRLNTRKSVRKPDTPTLMSDTCYTRGTALRTHTRAECRR